MVLQKLGSGEEVPQCLKESSFIMTIVLPICFLAYSALIRKILR